jgi:hypothetical protein
MFEAKPVAPVTEPCPHEHIGMEGQCHDCGARLAEAVGDWEMRCSRNAPAVLATEAFLSGETMHLRSKHQEYSRYWQGLRVSGHSKVPAGI